MALIALPNYLPVIDYQKIFNDSKCIKVVGSVVCGAHLTWKILRKISMSGNSKNPILRFLHQILRNYLNCGFLVRGEFKVSLPWLPWHYLWLYPGNQVIVNYGSYGTVPNTVMDYQINLQKELEAGPDFFYRINLPRKYKESLQKVSRAVGCDLNNLVYIDNVSDGILCALRSFLSDFDSDDYVMCTNLEYSAVRSSIRITTKHFNMKMLEVDINFPISSEQEVVDAFENMFQSHKNIKMAIFAHITSASATLLPIKAIANVCRKYGALSVVDGAHAPGQLELQLERYGVDVYIGNMYKWYYTPKNCAIMYVAPEHHDVMQPNLISHGCYGNMYERFRRQGVKDYSAKVTAGYAVDFMKNIGGIEFLHSYITPLVEFAVDLYTHEWGTTELQIPASMKAPYMRIVFLPDIFNKVYGTSQADGDNLVVNHIEMNNFVMIVTVVSSRLATRVSGQIFSSKSEYVYVANFIKNKARELETKFR